MMTYLTFAHTRDLDSLDNGWHSSWVRDVSYNDNSRELFLTTSNNARSDKRWGDSYLYTNVDPSEFEAIEAVAIAKGSVGHAVDEFQKNHKSIAKFNPDEYSFRYDTVNAVNYTSVVTTPEDEIEIPLAVGTEVQFRLDGDVKFTKSQKTVEEAVKDYLKSMELLGLDATLEAVHVYFVAPEVANK